MNENHGKKRRSNFYKKKKIPNISQHPSILNLDLEIEELRSCIYPSIDESSIHYQHYLKKEKLNPQKPIVFTVNPVSSLKPSFVSNPKFFQQSQYLVQNNVDRPRPKYGEYEWLQQNEESMPSYLYERKLETNAK